MKNGLPEKARVAVSKYRKTAMMGAAATALIAVAPAFAAAPGADASLQATIRNILRTPVKEASWRANSDAASSIPRFSAIDIGNSDDITVGDDQIAISHGETVEDVNVVNTGDLTGGVGIDVSTGAVDLSNAALDYLDSSTFEFRQRNIYDDSGNYVGQVFTADGTYNARATFLNPDAAASTISIDNSGAIDFSGREGIKAFNPSGQSITIANSGDITHTSDHMHRSGISAVTEWDGYSSSETQTQPGEFTYNAYGQLTGVISRDQVSYDRHDWLMLFDGGAINILNTGDIDMGPVDYYMGYRVRASNGIYTRGDGGTTIVNDGSIKIGQYSAGIFTYSSGPTSITNAGRIEVAGNNSAGIHMESLNNATALYDMGGDVYILNTGDIVGGVTIAETPPYQYTSVNGIETFAQGTNSASLGRVAELNQLINSYNEMLGEDVFTPYDIPYVNLYTTTVVNRGRIELADGARGIYMVQPVGDSIAINEGTITLGNGAPQWNSNSPHRAAGIYNSNLLVDGAGLVVSINTETGIIQTGDDGVGVAAFSYDGDSVAINDGVITTGNGVVRRQTVLTFPDYTYVTYDKLFHSAGIFARSADYHYGTTAYARNGGSVTVGELAIGSLVVGLGYGVLDPARITSLNVNEGIIESGDNSAGMFTRGTNATTVNTGTVNSGSYDIGQFIKGPDNGYRFEMTRNGVASSGAHYSEVINYGTINVGDGKVGASAEMSYDWGNGARIIQNGDGVITTGDHAIGARVSGDDFALFTNEGRISVGDDSVGADITAGGALKYTYEDTVTVTEGILQASNAGIIETGDNSVGVRMSGDLQDFTWHGDVIEIVTSPYGEWPVLVPVSGTVDIVSASYLANSGIIRVGANSTAVEITGTPGSEQGGLHLLNAGLIEATQASSTAVRVNADSALGSYVVNLGTIVGNMTFGAGDDHLMNTLMTSASGQVTGSGNIVMNDSTIDFGAGNNVFDNSSGMITLAGGDNLITGAEVVMTQGSIEARNNAVDSSLTINGNVSGSFAFGVDFDGNGTDQLIITGDVAEGASMNVVLNPTQQIKGESTFTVVTVDGENNAENLVAGASGKYADSLVNAVASVSAEGDVTVTARFGMGHMATSAASATTMAQDWWMQSVGSFDKRNLQQLAGLEDAGISAWATVFQEEGSVDPANDLQDVSFDQRLTGIQTGIEWQGKVGGGSLNIGPMFSYGNASANQDANVSSAMGDATAYGLNAGYRFSNGLYMNATWQQMAMEIDFRTPGTLSNAIGTTDAEGDGYSVEVGYAHKLKSGLTFAPVLQYASVSMDLDDFTTSDDVYALSEMGGEHALLRAGLSVFKTFETTNGSITPLVDLSYLDALDGDSALSSNGVVFDNDTTGSGYRAEVGVAGRYKGWDIAGRIGFAETAAIKSALSSNLTVRYRW